MSRMNYVSRLMQSKIITAPNSEFRHGSLSKSQRLFLELGVVNSSSNGFNVLLPLAMRSVTKLRNMINEKMTNVGAQEILLPTLTPSSLLAKTDRLGSSELFKLSDRHEKKFVLSPTHEEAVTNLIGNESMPWRYFPLRLYQVTSKFRDEMKPRFGLMRSREFLMKDLYCFDLDERSSLESYEGVTEQYESLFNELNVPYARVEGVAGDIGGSMSHEFHFLADIGEDRLVLCQNCKHMTNAALHDNVKCKYCGSVSLTTSHGIEVAHTFVLGKKYTEPLHCKYKNRTGQMEYLHMSCYGIGLTRIIAAAVDVLSSDTEIRWPVKIAPFLVCIIPPKRGSKEEAANHLMNVLQASLTDILNDTIIDDRVDMTIGKRLQDAKKIGYPYVLILGKSGILDEPLVEVHNTYMKSMDLIAPANVAEFLQSKLNSTTVEECRTQKVKV